MFNIA